MTNYTTLPNAAVQTGGVPRGSTITALRDNILAGLECDPTAPVNQAAWHPHNKLVGNDANNGVFYDFPVNGAVASVETPVFTDGYEYRIRVLEVSPASGSGSLQIELRRQSTGTYAGAATMITGAVATDIHSGEIILPTVRRSLRNHFITGYMRASPLAISNSIVASTPINLVQELTAATLIDRARISWAAAVNFDNGVLILERRRIYI